MTTLTAASPTIGGGAIAAGPGPTFTAAPSAGITPGDFFRVIRQRMLMVMLLGSLFAGLFVAAVIYWYVRYPGYAASALVKVTSVKPQDTLDPLNHGDTFDYKEIEREIQNQVHLLTSSTVLDDSLKNPTLRRTSWYAEAKQEAESRGENERDLLKDKLAVSPIRDSNLIHVSAVWRVPTEVDIIVNTVVGEYVKLVNQRARDSMGRRMDELRGELERSQKLFEEKKTEIENFIRGADIGSLGQEIDLEVGELTAYKTSLELTVSNLRAIKNQMESMQPRDVPIDEEMQQLLQQDPGIFQLEREAREAERYRDMQRRRFMENHAMAKVADAAYQVAQEKLSIARAQKIVQFQQRRIEEAVRNYERANTALIEIKDKLNLAHERQRDKDKKLARYESLLEERDLLRANYERMLTKQNELERILRLEHTVRIDVQSPAVPPKRVSSPNLKMFLPLAVIAGFGMSIGLAFLLDLTDKSVRTPRDVSRAHLPVLGTIPTTDDDEVDIERVETACLDAPHSVIAEAFRNLRANLFFSAPAEQQGVILVTSPSGGNGKTSVATNLAISIALSGRRVLLIDANLRRPSLPALFPMIPGEGLSNILIGQGQLRDYLCESQVPGLDLLGPGPLPPNPAELLGSSYLRDVIVDARSRYDQVVFDGPPALLVSDAMVLAGAVDGCLLVCQYRRTSRGALQRTRHNLDAINARIFGAVLNGVESRRGGYFRKQYREYYEYQELNDDQPERPALDMSAGVQPHTPRHGDGGPGGGRAISLYGRSTDGGIDDAMSDFEDDPTSGQESTIVVEVQPTAATTQQDEAADTALSPQAPAVDSGPGLDLGSLPDLSDLDNLNFRVDLDLDAPSSASDAPPASGGSARPSARDSGHEDDALDLDALADELEEIEGDEFRIDDRFDLGEDDVSEEDDPEQTR